MKIDMLKRWCKNNKDTTSTNNTFADSNKQCRDNENDIAAKNIKNTCLNTSNVALPFQVNNNDINNNISLKNNLNNLAINNKEFLERNLHQGYNSKYRYYTAKHSKTKYIKKYALKGLIAAGIFSIGLFGYSIYKTITQNNKGKKVFNNSNNNKKNTDTSRNFNEITNINKDNAKYKNLQFENDAVEQKNLQYEKDKSLEKVFYSVSDNTKQYDLPFTENTIKHENSQFKKDTVELKKSQVEKKFNLAEEKTAIEHQVSKLQNKFFIEKNNYSSNAIMWKNSCYYCTNGGIFKLSKHSANNVFVNIYSGKCCLLGIFDSNVYFYDFDSKVIKKFIRKKNRQLTFKDVFYEQNFIINNFFIYNKKLYCLESIKNRFIFKVVDLYDTKKQKILFDNNNCIVRIYICNLNVLLFLHNGAMWKAYKAVFKNNKLSKFEIIAKGQGIVDCLCLKSNKLYVVSNSIKQNCSVIYVYDKKVQINALYFDFKIKEILAYDSYVYILDTLNNIFKINVGAATFQKIYTNHNKNRCIDNICLVENILYMLFSDSTIKFLKLIVNKKQNNVKEEKKYNTFKHFNNNVYIDSKDIDNGNSKKCKSDTYSKTLVYDNLQISKLAYEKFDILPNYENACLKELKYNNEIINKYTCNFEFEIIKNIMVVHTNEIIV